MKNYTRACPLCGCENNAGLKFPYITRFNNQNFYYRKCQDCDTVYVDPIPSDASFAAMYSKVEYHDKFYSDDHDDLRYVMSVNLLRKYISGPILVLDYGCGFGGFLKALVNSDINAVGVEYDAEVTTIAAKNSNCSVVTLDIFTSGAFSNILFDVIHLGDVLEHLPNPISTIEYLLTRLKPNGLLFVEGPIEVNASLVYWSARLFGFVKRLLRPDFIAYNPPTHLFRTSANSQYVFFNQFKPRLLMRHWDVHETGWPYISGGVIKRIIAHVAIFLGKRTFFHINFGNRFRGIFMKDADNIH